MTRTRSRRTETEEEQWQLACRTLARERDRILVEAWQSGYEQFLRAVAELEVTILDMLHVQKDRSSVHRGLAEFRLLGSHATKQPYQEFRARLGEARELGFSSIQARMRVALLAARSAVEVRDVAGCLAELDIERQRLVQDGRCKRMLLWFDGVATGIRAEAIAVTASGDAGV